MSELKEIALVAYRNGAKEICEAPYSCGIREGTEVETDFGRGVVEKVDVIVDDDKVWQLIVKAMKVSKIRYRLVKFEYEEEEENVISD